MSIGKGVRAGAKLHVESTSDMYYKTPSGQRVRQALDDQDIFVFESPRRATSVTSSTSNSVSHAEHRVLLSPQIEASRVESTLYMHRLCSHSRQIEVLRATLKFTKGHTFNGKAILPATPPN